MLGDFWGPRIGETRVVLNRIQGAVVAEWLSSWLVEQEVRGSIPRLATWISEIGYLLLQRRDMAEIPLKRRTCKSSKQPTKQISRTTNKTKSLVYYILCRLRSISAQRVHFFRRLSVRPSLCLSGSHTFLVVTHSYVSQATHAFLGMLPLCYRNSVTTFI